MRVLYATRPYELVKGSCEKLYNKWNEICKEAVKRGKHSEFKRHKIENYVARELQVPIFINGELEECYSMEEMEHWFDD